LGRQLWSDLFLSGNIAPIQTTPEFTRELQTISTGFSKTATQNIGNVHEKEKRVFINKNFPAQSQRKKGAKKNNNNNKK
jgi:hypothetical protein